MTRIIFMVHMLFACILSEFFFYFIITAVVYWNSQRAETPR